MADRSADVADVLVDADEAPAVPRRGLSALTAAVLAALLGLAVGFGAGAWLTQPDRPGHDSPEAGFARDMSVHHGQAVEMGMIAYDRASLAQTRVLGYDIATTQQAQIGIMIAWLDKWGLPQSSRAPAMAWMPHGEHQLLADGRMKGMASDDQIQALRKAQGGEVDRLFATLMIEHHRAGIHMAEAILDITDDPDVRELAQGMVTAQKSEIEALNGILSAVPATK
ncbi:MAG: DUF305 domain-containing protein [Micromonosporaceae bacterium]